ncbi:Limb region 1 protein [Tupaia chinensis]|uniref:Limb region 1 protein n=1 Tax=Tupaia chinensis TaxID=246437 RepID=L9L4A9_TUPCH|nr:Limb region 1 protein [Tupaia chinensis]
MHLTGIRARVLETLVMLLLLALLVLGMVWVASALVDNGAASMESLYVCTPVGLSRMFTVMGQLLVKPAQMVMRCAGGTETAVAPTDVACLLWTSSGWGGTPGLLHMASSVCSKAIPPLAQAAHASIERRKKASAWERNLVYPAVMVLLLIETSISVLLVACNILCLLVDETAMPKGTRGPGIGNASLSTFGFVGAALEIVLIFYLMVSSVVGFYSLRFFGSFTPKKDDTTMTKIIGNCVSILVLSSALPVMSRTLGLHKLHLANTPRDAETPKPSANGHQKAL